MFVFVVEAGLNIYFFIKKLFFGTSGYHELWLEKLFLPSWP
jgi:hypothetical protein